MKLLTTLTLAAIAAISHAQWVYTSNITINSPTQFSLSCESGIRGSLVPGTGSINGHASGTGSTGTCTFAGNWYCYGGTPGDNIFYGTCAMKFSAAVTNTTGVQPYQYIKMTWPTDTRDYSSWSTVGPLANPVTGSDDFGTITPRRWANTWSMPFTVKMTYTGVTQVGSVYTFNYADVPDVDSFDGEDITGFPDIVWNVACGAQPTVTLG